MLGLRGGGTAGSELLANEGSFTCCSPSLELLPKSHPLTPPPTPAPGLTDLGQVPGRVHGLPVTLITAQSGTTPPSPLLGRPRPAVSSRLSLGSVTPISLAAEAAKSLQSCPTLCDTIDSSLQGSPVPGILQARVLEWVAIAFSLSLRSNSLPKTYRLLRTWDPDTWELEVRAGHLPLHGPRERKLGS